MIDSRHLDILTSAFFGHETPLFLGNFGAFDPVFSGSADQRPAFELPGNGSANDQSNEPSWAQDENMSSIWSSPCPGDGSFFQLVFGLTVFWEGNGTVVNTITLVLQFIGG